MSCDALFQLGMGSVQLNASQTEETPYPGASLARAEAPLDGHCSRVSGATACAPSRAGLPHTLIRQS